MYRESLDCGQRVTRSPLKSPQRCSTCTLRLSSRAMELSAGELDSAAVQHLRTGKSLPDLSASLTCCASHWLAAAAQMVAELRGSSSSTSSTSSKAIAIHKHKTSLD